MNEWWKIYTKDGCPWCVKTKELLQVHGVDYFEFNVTKDEPMRQMLKEQGHKTVPIIYCEGVLIGGYEDLQYYLQRRVNDRQEQKRSSFKGTCE